MVIVVNNSLCEAGMAIMAHKNSSRYHFIVWRLPLSLPILTSDMETFSKLLRIYDVAFYVQLECNYQLKR